VSTLDAESLRLIEDASRDVNWKRWGPYLSERQWGTVREDYSDSGNCWEYFPHDQARSRAYRWGEDGLLGITDRECRLCFALALWNGRDPILKERLFGLTNGEGNHGEDVKECYYYLDATPTSSYLRGLYKYPQMAYPYSQLVDENHRRGKFDPEFELADAGAFNENRYFDVLIEYAKNSPNDLLIRITVSNRGPEKATLHLLPTLWYRNTWSWGCKHEGCWPKPRITQADEHSLTANHVTLGRFHFIASDLMLADKPTGEFPTWLFTENETNHTRLFGHQNYSPYVKDSFHDYLVHGKPDAVNPKKHGTKAAAHYACEIEPGDSVTLRMRLCSDEESPWKQSSLSLTESASADGNGFSSDNTALIHKNAAVNKAGTDGQPSADKLTAVEASIFDRIFADRRAEADEYYADHIPVDLKPAEQDLARQAYAGLLWSKQFYEYIVKDWLEGDPEQPPPAERITGRNSDWTFLHNRDIISMPDKWEYPWYAAWDLAFHLVALGKVDVQFAMDQAVLFLREWYMHPNGQLPAYEFALSDVNPPVHAWAVWRLYKMSGPKRQRDRLFLARCFQKLLINFTWWVNRKDHTGRNLFSGGFLGMDNIGLFDRSQPLPPGVLLLQADGTAWMASYCLMMLSMAMELANDDPAYEDVASKFFEHFIAIVDAMNTFGGTGLWDEQDGFYYDAIHVGGKHRHLRARSMVGLIPLLAVVVLEDEIMDRLPSFKKRVNWFLQNRKDLGRHIAYCEHRTGQGRDGQLLGITTRERLERVLRYMLDETEFLSPYGIRSLSRFHQDHPCMVRSEFGEFSVNYDPGESTTSTFGGNSNWRGPIWFPVNYAIIEALQRYHYFYGDSLRVECPTGSGRWMNLDEVAVELSQRLVKLFLPDEQGRRPCHGDDRRYAEDPHWRDLILFYEYFHGDNGHGCGASHQTGWTALVVRLLDKFLRSSHPQASAAPQPTSLVPSAR